MAGGDGGGTALLFSKPEVKLSIWYNVEGASNPNLIFFM